MKHLIYLFVISILFSCNIIKKNKGTADNVFAKDSIRIEMRKTSCFGKCPVYSITITQDGQATYIGKQNVKKVGKYEIFLDKAVINDLFKAFEEANFFNFHDEYTAKITDLPTTYLTYTINDKTKTIKDYYKAPVELKNLEKLIEEIANSDGWKKISD